MKRYTPKQSAMPARQRRNKTKHATKKDVVQQVKKALPKNVRNKPCFCGSGKKYKKCHGVVSND